VTSSPPPPFETLVLATRNAGKLAEFDRLLRPLGVRLLAAAELGVGEVAEAGDSFADNARIKAGWAAKATGLPALADDSGLEVVGLGGLPGIHSARWAGPERDYGRAMARIHKELTHRYGSFARAERRAAFRCVLALAWPEGGMELFEGVVEGEIVWPPRGSGGFGYDPIFRPLGEARTFAEMSREEKDRLSHRGRAARALLRRLEELFGATGSPGRDADPQG